MPDEMMRVPAMARFGGRVLEAGGKKSDRRQPQSEAAAASGIWANGRAKRHHFAIPGFVSGKHIEAR
jgi:hypothetical protein